MRHRYVFAAALAIATALGVIGLPAAAQAASGITITSAGNPAGQPSVLDVTATDSLNTGIVGVTAQLTPVGGGTAYAPPALTLSAGTDTNGTWSVTIPPGAITAGNYTISVTATDASGPDTDPNAGTLGYLYQPALTAMSNVSGVTYGNQTVIFSGQLTASPPGGGPAVDEGSVPVYYAPLGGGTPVLLATTKSDGTYSATVNNVSGGTWVMTTNATSTIAAAQSGDVTVTGNPEQASLTNLVVSPTHLVYGETATLTGQVTLPGGVAAGAPVQIVDGTATLPTVTTDIAGNFTAKFPTSDGENLQVTAGANVPLLDSTTADLSITVAAPLHTRLFTAKLEGDGAVVSGICILTDPTNFTPFNASSVELQYAATKHGRWRNLGKLPALYFAYAPGNCQASGWTYYSDKQAPFGGRLLNAYYRVSVPGSAATESYTSPIVHSSIARSRIVSFSVNRTSVSQGSRLTFSGRLQRQSGRRWLGYGRERVYLEVKLKSQRLFQGYVVYARTSSSGRFKLSFIAGTPQARFVFAAYFAGSNQYLWSISKSFTVIFNGGATHGGVRLGSLILGAHQQVSALPRRFVLGQ